MRQSSHNRGLKPVRISQSLLDAPQQVDEDPLQQSVHHKNPWSVKKESNVEILGFVARGIKNRDIQFRPSTGAVFMQLRIREIPSRRQHALFLACQDKIVSIPLTEFFDFLVIGALNQMNSTNHTFDCVPPL